jgi:hypothetical protein
LVRPGIWLNNLSGGGGVGQAYESDDEP